MEASDSIGQTIVFISHEVLGLLHRWHLHRLHPDAIVPQPQQWLEEAEEGFLVQSKFCSKYLICQVRHCGQCMSKGYILAWCAASDGRHGGSGLRDLYSHGFTCSWNACEAAYLQRDLVTMNTSLRAMVDAAKWRQALLLLKHMVNSTRVDVVSFTEGIAACGAVARWQQAMSLLVLADEQMVAHDSHSYNSAIAACDGASCWTIALLLADDMHRRQVQQNLVSMNSCISAASNAAAWPVVAALLQKLPDMLIRPDDITYGSVINAFQKAARWQMALHFMALWQGRGSARWTQARMNMSNSLRH